MKRTSILFSAILIVFFFTIAHAEKQRGNAVSRQAFPSDLKGYDVVDYHVPLKTRYIGRLQSMRGTAIVMHGDKKQAYFAQKRDKLYKGDVIFSLDNSRCRIKFTTRDVITLGDNSRISMDDYVDRPKKGKKKTKFGLARGKAMFYVVRMFRYKDSSTSVSTRTAIMGVRGTKFGVEVRESVGKSASLLDNASKPFYLADNSNFLALKYLAATNLAATGDQDTVVYGFDGQVDVFSPAGGDSQTVGEGQNLEITPAGAGQVVPTPAGVSAQFQDSTEAPPPPADDSGDEDSSTAPANEGGDDSKEEAKEETNEETKEEANEETNEETNDEPREEAKQEPSEEPNVESEVQPEKPEVPIDLEVTPEVTRYGYFAAMNTYNNQSVADVYVTENRSLYPGSVSGKSVTSGSSDTITFNEGFDYLKETNITDGSTLYKETYGSSETPVQNLTKIDSNAYMEWGKWNITDSFTYGNNKSGSIDNYAYYVLGEPTPDTYDLGNSTYTYSGTAQGTWWSATGGTTLTGTFSFEFNRTSVSDFDLSVTGNDGTNDLGVQIDSATGSLNGTQFGIDSNTGTWKFHSSGAVIQSATGADANGSLYGPNAENAGGVWGMKSGDYGANGYFEGTKGATPATAPRMPIHNVGDGGGGGENDAGPPCCADNNTQVI